ncbi:MAG TPA: hypothetical protein DCG34_04975 [Clostridiales bacterium]|nr:hypothetical protein [Clostridiales bacterium]
MEKKNLLSIGLLSKRHPDTFFDLKNGQGTFMYNHNIKEVLVIEDLDGGATITEDAEESTARMFQYDSLRCEFPKNSDNIFATLLEANYPPQKESQLWNEYKSAELGLLDESFKEPYEAFLADRLLIKAMVELDCEAQNIL